MVATSTKDRPMDQRKVTSALTVVGCAAAIGAYMAAYYALVQRGDSMWLPEPFAQYRWGGEIAEPLFFPAHCIDKIIRPGAWGPWVPDAEAVRNAERKGRAEPQLPDRPVAD